MTHMTKRDGVEAAMSVAEDISAGRLDPVQLEADVVTVCRQLFSDVAGPDDPLWPLQIEVTRAVLARHGRPAAEVAEWVSAARRAEADDGGPGAPGREPWPHSPGTIEVRDEAGY